MEEKCGKYESLFIFGSHDDFENHLKICSECRAEHEKYQKVAKLVKEVKPLYKQQKQNKKIFVSIAAGFITLFLVFFAVNHQNSSSLRISSSNLENTTVQEISIINQMGFPTDEYGLLMVE